MESDKADKFQRQFRQKMNSYIPELRRRDDEPGSALLLTCRDLLEVSRERVGRLFEKHRAELYNRALPEASIEQETSYTAYVHFSSDTAARISTSDTFTCFDGRTEAAYRVSEAYLLNQAELSEILVTEPERDGYTRLYCKEDGDFKDTGFAAAKESPDNFARLAIEGRNLFIANEPPLLDGASVPALYENAEAFSWTLETEDASTPVEVIKEAEGLRISAKELAGACRLTACCEKAAKLAQGEIYMPVLSCYGEALPDYLAARGEICFDSMLPFGSPLMVGGECFIACDAAFGIPNAETVLTFTVSFEDEFIPYRGIVKDGETPVTRECFADCVTLQYFNGKTFIPFAESGRYGGVLSGEGDKEIRLVMPADSEKALINGIEAYWIRLRLESAKNLNYSPLIIHSPKIDNIRLRYSAKPDILRVTYENTDGRQDITELLREGFRIFSPLYPERKLYIGFRGGLSQALNLFVKRDSPCHAPVIGDDWRLISSSGGEPAAFTDGTGGFKETGILSLRLPDKAGYAVRLFGEERLYLCVTLLSEEGLSGITDLCQNVCSAYGNTPLAAGAALAGGGGIYAEMLCDSVLASPVYDCETMDGAKFHIVNKGRYMTEAALRQAVLRCFPSVKECLCRYDAKNNTVAVGVYFGDEDAFSLQKEGLLLFLRAHCPKIAEYAVVRFAPVYVSVRASVYTARLDDISQALCGYIEDKALWKPGVLPEKEDIAGFFADSGIRYSYLTVLYSAETNGKASLCAADFPFSLAVSGTHELINTPQKEDGYARNGLP